MVITDIIKHELIVGTNSEKEYKKLKELLSPLEILRLTDDKTEDFDTFSWVLRRKGFTGKYTDLNIAYLSKVYDYPVLSFDHYFFGHLNLIRVSKFEIRV